jgi:hypothetical protein
MDEKPASTAPSKVSTMQHVGKKARPMEAAHGDPDRVYTAVCAVSASGVALPMMIIKQGVMMSSPSSQLVKKTVKTHKNYMYLTPSGWITGDAMLHWLTHVFARHAILPCALIMDGYPAHWTDEVRAAARRLKIELINMPANRTNEIQPLDVGVFGALQTMTDRDWATDDTVSDYLHAFQQSWADFTTLSIRSAFYKALALEDGILEDTPAAATARRSRIQAENAMVMIDTAVDSFIDAMKQS